MKFDMKKASVFLLDNAVVILFIAITIFGVVVSRGGMFNDYSIYFVNFFGELMDRAFRNSFLVLSLLIPVIAGLGLNFGIVVGAASGQMAIIFLRYHNIGGLSGFFLCLLLATPIAIFFGYLTGKLYNKVRGQEMIAGLIVSYFANGVYNFIFLFAVGYIIPVSGTNPIIMPANLAGRAVGVRMSVDMGTIKYALDNIIRIPFLYFLIIVALLMMSYIVTSHIRKHKKDKSAFIGALINAVCVIAIIALSQLGLPRYIAAGLGVLGMLVSYGALFHFNINNKNAAGAKTGKLALAFNCALATGIGVFGMYNTFLSTSLIRVRGVPLVTAVFFAVLCIFINYIMSTKLGQDFRSVGQNQHIAEVSGINVSRTRIIATIFSTVLAAWGMVIFLQNMGTIATYDSHRTIGILSVAAILVGGASTSKASISNVITGVILFNAMTIVSPDIGNNIFGEPSAGEYFRTFLVYGVIGLSLGLYIWKTVKEKQRMNSL